MTPVVNLFISVLQLMFDTSIPEKIVIVKSVHGKLKCKKKAAEPDGDSDEEARQMIDEAENEQDNETGPSAGMTLTCGACCLCCSLYVTF